VVTHHPAPKLVKIGARIVRHGRYVVFQMAEVAVPRALFAEILRRIDHLRPKPPPLPAWGSRAMNDDNPSRRDASIIDRELRERGAKQGRKPHNAGLAQRHGLARTVRGLPAGAQDAMIGLRGPANGNPG
jgi:hypothetical protein